jgi:nicotinate-nucleotide adenylyltransferase
LARVLFMPAGDPPHKQQLQKSRADHRRRMVALAIADNPFFALDSVDLDRPGPHYTIDTIQLIRSQYDLAADDCFFIIGSDSLHDLPTWHRPDKLVTLCRLAIACRPGYQPDVTALEKLIPGLAGRLDWVETPLFDVSSTLIRAKVAQGRTIRYHVPDQVAHYIEAHQLYHAEVKDESETPQLGAGP